MILRRHKRMLAVGVSDTKAGFLIRLTMGDGLPSLSPLVGCAVQRVAPHSRALFGSFQTGRAPWVDERLCQA